MDTPTDTTAKTNSDGPTSPINKGKKKKIISKNKKTSNSKKKLNVKSKAKKKKKKSKKKRVRKKPIKPAKISIKDNDENQCNNTNNNNNNNQITDENSNDNSTSPCKIAIDASNIDNINSLHTTYTSPIHSFNTLAQETLKETSNIDLPNIDSEINENKTQLQQNQNESQPKTDAIIAPQSPLEAIKMHKLMKIKENNNHKKSKKNKQKKSHKSIEKKQMDMDENLNANTHFSLINMSYFQNYFDRSFNIPNEMSNLLDKIETDLQFIFNDTFLNKSIRTTKILNLCISLHMAFIEYKFNFVLPICKINLTELDSMFSLIIKYFNRFKRYHRSVEILKYKQQINKLKTNVDILIAKIETSCSIILYALIRAKQLFLEFHKNAKLLIFWMELFPANELEFVELSWLDFVNNVRQNKSFKKFKKFKPKEMVNVLNENYEVLTIREFLKYVLEYESVGGWLNDMYSYIDTEITNPHKKSNNSKKKYNSNITLTHLNEFSNSIQQMIKNTIQDEMNCKFNELSSKFSQMEQAIDHIKTNQLRDAMDENDHDDNIMDNVAAFEPITSNGTVILHKESNDMNDMDDMDDGLSDQSTYSSSHEHENNNILIKQEHKWHSMVESLENQISALKKENSEYKEKLNDYELRLNGVTMKSKQVFSLQTKMNYYEKLASLIKKRCLSVHKQLQQDLTQLSMWYKNNSANLQHDNDGIDTDTQQNKLLEIQTLFNNYLNENDIDNDEQIHEIQTLFKQILDSNGKTLKLNKKSYVMWQRMRNSLQHGTDEILCVHKQLNDNFITNDNMTTPVSLSPLSPLPQLYDRPQSAKILAAKKTHKRQNTFSVATLKRMNNKIISNSSVNNKQRTRTYSAHDLEQLKFIPLGHNNYNNNNNNNNNSFDLYTNKIKKKRVSFVPKMGGLDVVKVRNIKAVHNNNNNNNVVNNNTQNNINEIEIADKGKIMKRKRRNSDSHLLQIKNSNDKKEMNGLHKLFEKECKLNSDTINKIRIELLKENKINRHFQRRHSMCLFNDENNVSSSDSNPNNIFGNENKENNGNNISEIQNANDLNNLIEEKPINYNNFSTRSRATSAGNKARLIGLYGDSEFSDDDLLRMRQTHFRNHSTLNKRSLLSSVGIVSKLKIKKRKHKRYKTATMNRRNFINPALLSANWAANIALNTVTDDILYDGGNDESASDVISTLSNIDYTFMLDEYDENDSDDEHKQYVNIYGDRDEIINIDENENENDMVSLHERRRSYRFPNENTQESNKNKIAIIDPFDLLDDKMLTELKKEQEQLAEHEIEMKTKLITMLREMDLMGQARLDLADFTSAIMNVVDNYNDLMEDTELLFDGLQAQQDDMGAIKIEIIVDAIMLNKNNDGAAKNIKKEIMCGLKLNTNQKKKKDLNNQNQNMNIEDMPQLYVKPKVIDPNAQPYKPIYQTSNAIQKIGKNIND